MPVLEVIAAAALGVAWALVPVVERWRALKPAPPEPQPLAPDLRAVHRLDARR